MKLAFVVIMGIALMLFSPSIMSMAQTDMNVTKSNSGCMMSGSDQGSCIQMQASGESCKCTADCRKDKDSKCACCSKDGGKCENCECKGCKDCKHNCTEKCSSGCADCRDANKACADCGCPKCDTCSNSGCMKKEGKKCNKSFRYNRFADSSSISSKISSDSACVIGCGCAAMDDPSCECSKCMG